MTDTTDPTIAEIAAGDRTGLPAAVVSADIIPSGTVGNPTRTRTPADYPHRRGAEAAAAYFDDPTLDGSDAVGVAVDNLAVLADELMRANTYAAFMHAIANLSATIDAAIDADDPDTDLAARGCTGDAYKLIDAVQDHTAEIVGALVAELGDFESAASAIVDESAHVGQYDDTAAAAEDIVSEWYNDIAGIAPDDACKEFGRLWSVVVVDWAATWQADVRHDYTYHEISGHLFRSC